MWQFASTPRCEKTLGNVGASALDALGIDYTREFRYSLNISFVTYKRIAAGLGGWWLGSQTRSSGGWSLAGMRACLSLSLSLSVSLSLPVCNYVLTDVAAALYATPVKRAASKMDHQRCVETTEARECVKWLREILEVWQKRKGKKEKLIR